MRRRASGVSSTTRHARETAWRHIVECREQAFLRSGLLLGLLPQVHIPGPVFAEKELLGRQGVTGAIDDHSIGRFYYAGPHKLEQSCKGNAAAGSAEMPSILARTCMARKASSSLTLSKTPRVSLTWPRSIV